MEAIASAHAVLEDKGNLSRAIGDVQTLINQLQRARDAVAESPERAAVHVAELRKPVKTSFDKIEDDLKEVNKGLNQYQKAIKDKFKSAQLPSADTNVLGKETGLVDRAIAMHLLREGKFGVASAFVKEVNEQHAMAMSTDSLDERESAGLRSWAEDFSLDPDTIEEEDDTEDGEVDHRGLHRKFRDMYHILSALREHHNLAPAITWARDHSSDLDSRGSNLEFELCRLKFIELYTSMEGSLDEFSGPIRALEYARHTFPAFGTKYIGETSSLFGSLAFSAYSDCGPYGFSYHDQSIYDMVSNTFTREFCGMLGLSDASPLYTAVTAGGISLPILEKVERVMAQSRGQWNSVNELPVETPLPPGMQFHSIFVCPVSKEQATDANPPMLLPCGHVIAKESLEQHARGKSRMKCPYCPGESHPKEAKELFI